MLYYFQRVFKIFTCIEATIFTILGLRFLGLDGPYLSLLGPLLAPSLQFNSLDLRESGLDPVKEKKSRPKFSAIVFGHSTSQIRLGWPRNHHEKIRLEISHLWVSAACQTEIVVQFYDQNTCFPPGLYHQPALLICRSSNSFRRLAVALAQSLPRKQV